MSLPIPRSQADLSTAWLTEALGVPVADFTATTIAEGTGFMGRLARVGLTYAEGATGPASVIAKMPTDDPGGVALGQLLKLWEREARFYLDLAPKLPVRTPRCHYAGGDAESGIFAMLLEDLSDLTCGDQIGGLTGAQATAAIDWLARFHAAEAGGGHAAGLDWLPSTAFAAADPMYQGLQPMLEAVWPGFVDHFAGHAPGRTIDWVAQLVPRFSEAFGEEPMPATVVHADFRADNIFFGDHDEVVVIDWQAVALGQGIYDVAYLLAGSLTVDQRRAMEHELVERYRQGLIAGGATVPSEQELFDVYRKTMYFTMGVAALLIAQLDFTVNERAGELARTTVERFYTAGDDLDVGEFADGA